MTGANDLIIRNAEIRGAAGLDIQILDGRIAEIGAGLPGLGQELDAAGGAVIPGLIDHHIHLLATAARAESLNLDSVSSASGFAAALRAFAAERPPGRWIRALGYHDRIAGVLTREDLDALVPDRPVRVQHQTGGLWMLNSRALDLVATGETPDAVERDAAGRPTGRIWRGDDWLKTRLPPTPPNLAPVGARLAALGVVGVMDASVTNNASTAVLLADAVRSGVLPQRLALMSGGSLAPPDDAAYVVGPVKILLDDHALPDLAELIGHIARARSSGRPVAVHCVAAGELALTLAAFEAAGARPGDRIEHGGMIAAAAIPTIVRLGLTVVTQSAFVFERGDRYLADIDPGEHDDLYRCRSLLEAGAPVAGSSDAPYADPDPWRAMQTAVTRRTRGGRSIGPGERVSSRRALGLYLGGFERPGGPGRRVAVGSDADLCILKAPIAEALISLSSDLIAATLKAGRLIHTNL